MPLVKVLWHRHGVEATWEMEETMKISLGRFSRTKISLGGEL